MRKHGLIRLLALAAAIALCLSACSSDAALSPDDADVILPDPEKAETRQILGESFERESYEVTLHFASENSLSLSSAMRTVRPERGETLIESILDEVLASASLSGSVEARVLHAEEGGGVVTVNLSIEAGANRSEQDYLLLCASIANSMLELDAVEAVNVLVGGRSEAISGLPFGAFVEAQDNIAALYAQAQTEADRFLAESGGAFINRNALLYFPAQGGEYLLPEVRELRFESADYITPILEALSADPLMRACCFSAIPVDMNLLENKAYVHASEAGERIAELNFSSMLGNYLAFTGVDPWQLYGSIVLSLCSFVPELDGVRISMDGEAITECSLNGRTLRFADGIMRRGDFDEAVGGSSRLYFGRGERALSAAETPMAQSAAASPRRLLEELIQANAQPPEGAQNVFPEGIFPQDILGVCVEDGVATVNLSSNFYARCQNLNAAQERQLIYAMVNTLAELNEIGAVSFLVEGRGVDRLAQNIYLGTALLPDPGLVQAPMPEPVFE